MIKIGELYRREGVWNGQRIVPSAWIKESITPATYESQIGGPLEYGLLWWIFTEPELSGYSAVGFGGQRIIVLPRSQAVIVYLSEVRPDSQIDDPRQLESLDNVIIAAFR